MYLFLRDLIVLFQDIEGENVFWYDLAILFTNFFLKNEKNNYFRNVMEKTTISFLNFADNTQFYFSEKVIEVLKKNTKIYSSKEVNTLFINIFGCLKLFKEYQIKLRYKEFANFFYDLCELFLPGNNLNFFKPANKTSYYFFHFVHFQKTLEMDKDSEKVLFLCLMFSLLCNFPFTFKSVDIRTENLNTIISRFQKIIQDPIILKEVIGGKKLIENAFSEYLLNHII